jgi:hypothetical protein
MISGADQLGLVVPIRYIRHFDCNMSCGLELMICPELRDVVDRPHHLWDRGPSSSEMMQHPRKSGLRYGSMIRAGLFNF